MSWIQNLYETYDACNEAIGVSDGNQAKMLLPLGHLLAQPDIIIYLNKDGELQKAEKIESSNKNKVLICTPCTDESEGRSSRKAINFPHPLFDQVKYLNTQTYIDNLKCWIDYLTQTSEHKYAVQMLEAVYMYIQQKTLISDLKLYNIKTTDKSFVAFCVRDDDVLEDRLWMIPDIWNAWTSYYFFKCIPEKASSSVCYVSGHELPYTSKHPKSINRSAGNAKLITGDDSDNFTFRGRFTQSSQAVTVSYEASQKAHQALRWLISSQNCYRCKSQAIIAWAVDSQPEVLSFYENSYDLYNSRVKTDYDKLTEVQGIISTDYAEIMKKLLMSCGNVAKVKTYKRRIAIMATDSTTVKTGRMSVTYYREMSEGEYEEKITSWHDTCKWFQPFDRDSEGNYQSGYFIGAPSIDRIVLAVLGERRSFEDESHYKLEKDIREQLVHYIFDGDHIQPGIVNIAVNHASNPLSFENTKARTSKDRWRTWWYALSAACALTKRYYHDIKREEFKVMLESERRDRDYLYGRLLAVANKIESSARYKQGNIKDDARATNAIRYMTVFSQHPFRTWNMLFTQQLNPYIQQLKGADWYLGLIGDIQDLFELGEFENDSPLDGRYLLGFFAQTIELKKAMNLKNKSGGDCDDSVKQD